MEVTEEKKYKIIKCGTTAEYSKQNGPIKLQMNTFLKELVLQKHNEKKESDS